MPMTCVAYGCNNHFVKGCGKQFFRFPMKDPDRLSKWVMDIRRKNWKPSASSRICSDHFTESDYMLRPGAMVPRLRLDAVPSVFNGFPSYLKERLKKKKTSKKKINEQIIVMDDQHGTRDAVQNEVDKMKTCAVYGCNNTCYEGCQQRFFRFPTNDSEMLSKWLVAIHHGNCTSLTSNSICSDHFTENDYIVYPGATVPQLGPDAVPSLFPGLPTEIQAVVEPQNTQQADPTKNTVQSEIIKTKLHEISNKQSLSPQTQQVKHGPSERSRAVTCVVNDCSTIFVKGCGKRFFRFPMKNPQHLFKWLKALQSPGWKPSASSRICSDHFKEKDYILQPGTLVPRLRLNAVPSVCKARKRRRKQITTTDQNFGNCGSMEVVGGFQETEIHRPCDHTYSAVHNEKDLPRFNPDTVKLKKKLRTLQRQIQRQRHAITKLSERIAQLKNITAQLHLK